MFLGMGNLFLAAHEDGDDHSCWNGQDEDGGRREVEFGGDGIRQCNGDDAVSMTYSRGWGTLFWRCTRTRMIIAARIGELRVAAAKKENSPAAESSELLIGMVGAQARHDLGDPSCGGGATWGRALEGWHRRRPWQDSGARRWRASVTFFARMRA